MVDALKPTIVKEGASLVRYSLDDAISCVVAKSESGEYYLQMEYPANGVFSEEIALRNQINAITSRANAESEPFLISKIEQNINGIISVTANHVTYDLSKYPVRSFEKSSMTPEEAVMALFANSVRDPNVDSLYVSAAASTVKKEFGFNSPTTFRDALYGHEGLLSVFGGVLISSGRSVKWYNKESLGTNKGTIRYGVNLSKFKRIFDVSDTYSHAYVYWKDGESFVQCPQLVQIGSEQEFVGATVLDLSSEFDEEPTVEQLQTRAQDIAFNRELANTEVNLNISFVPLRLTDEYKGMTWLEEIDLFDKVTVEVPMYGSKTYARVTKTQFDVLSESYKNITVGTPGRSLENTIAHLI